MPRQCHRARMTLADLGFPSRVPPTRGPAQLIPDGPHGRPAAPGHREPTRIRLRGPGRGRAAVGGGAPARCWCKRAAVPAGRHPSASSSRRSKMTYVRSLDRRLPRTGIGPNRRRRAASGRRRRAVRRLNASQGSFLARRQVVVAHPFGQRRTEHAPFRRTHREELLHARSQLPRIPSTGGGWRMADGGISLSQTVSARGRRGRLAVLMAAWAPLRSGPVEAVAPRRRYRAAGFRALGRSSNAPVTRSS